MAEELETVDKSDTTYDKAIYWWEKYSCPDWEGRNVVGNTDWFNGIVCTMTGVGFTTTYTYGSFISSKFL